MTFTLDLNADIGELTTPEGAASERDILRYVTTCSIACAAHAGDKASMRDRIIAAKQAGVKIGAHPSYVDRENFGRKSYQLGRDISASDLSVQLHGQISQLSEMAAGLGHPLTHVKPHGALYNDSGRHPHMADILADVIANISAELLFVGAPNCAHGPAAQKAGLGFIAEGFMDRAYGDDGQIVARSTAGALITDQEARLEQLLSIAVNRQAASQSGRVIALPVQTICLHGDSAGAVQSAKAARKALIQAGVDLRAFAK